MILPSPSLLIDNYLLNRFLCSDGNGDGKVTATVYRHYIFKEKRLKILMYKAFHRFLGNRCFCDEKWQKTAVFAATYVLL